MHRSGRCGASRTDDHQSRRERSRRDADQRAPDDRHAMPEDGRTARRFDRAACFRHGDRDGPRDEAPYFRTVLHHEGAVRDRARAHDRPRYPAQGCGGSVHVASEPGLGTEFEVVFPRAVDAEASVLAREVASDEGAMPPSPPPSRSDVLGCTGTRPPRALVIEDAHDTCELFASELTLAGFIVVRAANGEDGLERARQFEPDVIVLDLMLPGVNGFSVARAVRARERQRNVSIVAVSARSRRKPSASWRSTRVATPSSVSPWSRPRWSRRPLLLLDRRADRQGISSRNED